MYVCVCVYIYIYIYIYIYHYNWPAVCDTISVFQPVYLCFSLFFFFDHQGPLAAFFMESYLTRRTQAKRNKSL